MEHGLILGLEAPLCVPLRPDLQLATKARKGEGRRPWSAGAGAQVLTMNLPIMSYLFRVIVAAQTEVKFALNEDSFQGQAGQIMLFEALVSGEDKGDSHVNDAQIMAWACQGYARQKQLPPSILEPEADTEYFNLAAASLLRCGFEHDLSSLHAATPIYKPSANAKTLVPA